MPSICAVEAASFCMFSLLLSRYSSDPDLFVLVADFSAQLYSVGAVNQTAR